MYDDFARIPRTAAAAQQSAGQPRPAGGLSGPEGGEQPGGGMPGEAEQVAAVGAAGLAPPGADLRSRFISWLQRMDLAIAKDRQANLAQLSDGSGGRDGWGGWGGCGWRRRRMQGPCWQQPGQAGKWQSRSPLLPPPAAPPAALPACPQRSRCW